MSAKNTTADRSTHSWTPDQLQYLADHPSMGRSELVAGFRKKFPKFGASDQAIVGRRYRLIHSPSRKRPELVQSAIENRIEALEAELAQERERLASIVDGSYFDQGPSVPTVEEMTSMDIKDLRTLADKFGVSKGGGKAAIAERITSAA